MEATPAPQARVPTRAGAGRKSRAQLPRTEGLADVTSYDRIVVMIEVKIADLKARLSEHLRRVRRGHVLLVLDRDTPIARVVPYEESEPLRVRQPLGRSPTLQDVPLPPPLPIDFDVVDLLLEERRGDR